MCWHSTVCLLPSERVTGRQEEEDKEEFEKWKEVDWTMTRGIRGIRSTGKQEEGDKEEFEKWKKGGQ